MPKEKIKAEGKRKAPAKRKIGKFPLRVQTSSQASHRGIRVLFMGLLLLGMGQSLFFAVLPPVARDLGLNESQTAIIFSLSALLWVFCSPFWGRQSDVWGRRRVMVIGLSGFSVSTLLITAVIFAGNNGWITAALVLPLLIVTRSLFGIFGSGTMPAAQAYMADRTTRARRTKGASMLMASFGIGNIIGPAFAASLIVFGFLTPFVFVGVLGLLSALMVFFWVPEKNRVRFKKHKEEKMSAFAKPLRVFIVLGSLASYAQSVLIQLTAFYFIDKLVLSNADGTQLVSIGFTFMAMATLFAQFVIIQRFEPPIRSMLIYSGLILAGGFLGLGLSTNFASMVMCLGVCGLGFGLMRPGLMAAASLSVGRQNQGAAAGAINATAAIGHVINPFTGAIIYTYYPSAPFLIVAGTMMVFFVVVLLHPRVKKLGSRSLDVDEDYIPAPHVPIGSQQMMAQVSKPVTAEPKQKKIDSKKKKPYSKKLNRKGAK